jgi:hypothetical protein
MKDSIKHYLVSAVGSFLITFFLFLFFEDKEIAIYIGPMIMFIIGILKEVIWDWLMKRGVPSLADITSDAMGVGTAMFIMLMFI